MPTDYAYTDLPVNLRFTDDGETAIIETSLNGVPVRLFTLYVGDQREKFDEAKQNHAAQSSSASDTGSQ